jgi:outer membrane protein assembly factor BamB
MSRRPVCVLVLLGLVSVLGGPGARAEAACAGPAPGGEWRSYGHDLANSRHQDQETIIDAGRAAKLAPRWVFSAEAAGAGGDFENTPAVADGCLFLGSTDGWVLALNADTGELVWKTQLPYGVGGSLAIADGLVLANVNRGNVPSTVALDETTGALVWQSVPLDAQHGTEILSSPVVFDGMVIVGVSGAGAEAGTTFFGTQDSRLFFRGTYVLLDERTGAILFKGWVIPDDDFARGFSGGGVWSTAAVDLDAHYAYIGSGNPFSPHEHPNTNSLLKIDVDRSRATFGQIVAGYHGTPDLYAQGATYKPHCEAYVDVFTCETSDFDFGASPQLFTDAGGRSLVGDMQKGSVYHAADRDTMQGVWQTTIGAPFGWLGGMSTASFDGTSISVGGSAPGLVAALDPATGAAAWVAPIADAIHFQPVTTANGVTYGTDSRDVLDAWDTATGAQVLARPLAIDRGRPGSPSQGSGVVVARNTVYVPVSGGFLVAYQ